MRIAILVVLFAACTTSNPCDQGADLPPCGDCQPGAVQLGRFFCDGQRSWMTGDGKLAHLSGNTVEILDEHFATVRSFLAGNDVLAVSLGADGSSAVLASAGARLAVTLVDASGKNVWTADAGAASLGVVGSIALGPSRVFATTSGIAMAFDRATGSPAWSHSDLASTAVLADPAGGAVVAGHDVTAVDDAGTPRWTTPLAAASITVTSLARDASGRIGIAAEWTGGTATVGGTTLTASNVPTKALVAMLDATGTVQWARNYLDDTSQASINSTVVVGDQLAVGGSASGMGTLDLAGATGNMRIATATGVGIHDIIALGMPDASSLLVSIGSFSDPEAYDHNALDSQPPPPTLQFDGVGLDGDGVALARLAL